MPRVPYARNGVSKGSEGTETVTFVVLVDLVAKSWMRQNQRAKAAFGRSSAD